MIDRIKQYFRKKRSELKAKKYLKEYGEWEFCNPQVHRTLEMAYSELSRESKEIPHKALMQNITIINNLCARLKIRYDVVGQKTDPWRLARNTLSEIIQGLRPEYMTQQLKLCMEPN